MAKRIRIRVTPHNPKTNHGPDIAALGLKLVGPFPGNTTPSREGIFKRASPNRPGKFVWSFWNGRNWGMLGTNFKRAIERKNKTSSKQDLEWYGTAPVTGSVKGKVQTATA